MQTPAVFQEAMQTVFEAPLWLKTLLPLLGMLIRHFWPQTGALIDKVLSLVGRRPVDAETPVDGTSQSILALIDRLLARREAAVQEGDSACVDGCNRKLQSLFEMLQ
ncbi:hypothetical protein [Lignipirellula cremea]|uniref:Uncharacterized protein n=1 Tax=Lignipirellula cremea TaxID=2528010 RepID=A0A518E0C3_9BACT|nr:hypothetical protein [Lignipirellula cremea]QDU97538.1 hypothetical protein Pla8534_53860 [Lignipirellula cremea]